jgi:hypothetical protein
MKLIVQPKSISLLKAWAKIFNLFTIFVGTIITIIILNYNIKGSLYADKVMILFGVFIPTSLILAWFVVMARKIEMNVVWVVSHDEIICNKYGKEISRVRWNAIKRIIHKKHRLVLVTCPRSGMWALNGVDKDDVKQIKKLWENRLKMDDTDADSIDQKSQSDNPPF